MSRRLAVKR